MHTLITGAGLIGSRVARLLRKCGEPTGRYDLNAERSAIASVVDLARVGLIRGDVEALESLDRVRREHKGDRILHTATLFTTGICEEPLQGIRTNILGTASVLESARRAGARRVIFTRSSTVYLPPRGSAPVGPLVGRRRDACGDPASVVDLCRRESCGGSLGAAVCRTVGRGRCRGSAGRGPRPQARSLGRDCRKADAHLA